MPIYNVEDYLEESILSIVNQTIGFKDNVQLILINDGSPDNSYLICQKYKELYPDNIVYVEQQNSGVSTARNNGLKHAQGTYINFLDSDDKWPIDAFEKVEKFFDEHKEIDVIACMLEYFEAKSDLSHPLNRKFDSDRVIDILFEPNSLQMHMASCFIRREIVDVEFDTQLKYAEDSLFINQLILKKLEYGVMSSVHYMYRKRATENSALDTCQLKQDFYLKTVERFHQKIIDISIQKYNKVIQYIQFVVMYDLQWRIKRPIINNVIDEKEKRLYREKIQSLIQYIDDIIIMYQQELSLEHKMFTLCLKYGRDITKEFVQFKNQYFFNNIKIFSCKNKNIVKLSSLIIKDNVIHIEGVINTAISADCYSIYIQDENRVQYPITDIVDYVKREKQTFKGHYYYEKWFKIDIPLSKGIRRLRFKLLYKGGCPVNLDLGHTETCRLNTSTPRGYVKFPNNIVEYRNCKIIIRNNSKKLHLKKELRLLIEVFRKKLYKLVFYRLLIFLRYYLPSKDIWIVSDRPDAAGDNGEAFFKYMRTVKDKNRKVYFAINKSSKDYKKMKKYGKVLNFGSMKYKLKFLRASKIISSQASDYIINPFGENRDYVKDLYGFDFVFLQHGITKDDISTWLNKVAKDIRIFVTAGKPEYESIVNGDYYYGEEVVRLTGFPRHDYLESNPPSKQIAIIPTWRHSIPGCVGANDTSIYNEDFKESDFFKFYNSLINHPQLLKTMRERGYTGIFCLHPLFEAQAPHFDGNDVFKINEGKVNYQFIFSNYDLLITDYSSVFFDFSYLYKPVLYSQFDKEEFFATHSYDKGYFDYERDGFGKVSYNVEDTVNNIIELIMSDCKIEQKYKDKIDAFFPKDRGHNSENVYNAILKL